MTTIRGFDLINNRGEFLKWEKANLGRPATIMYHVTPIFYPCWCAPRWTSDEECEAQILYHTEINEMYQAQSGGGVICPFCGEGGFDLRGFKIHITRIGYCEKTGNY